MTNFVTFVFATIGFILLWRMLSPLKPTTNRLAGKKTGKTKEWRSAMTNFCKRGWRLLTFPFRGLGILRDDARGLYFNELTWNVIVRPVVSLLTGGFYTGIIWLLGEYFDFQLLEGIWITATLALLSILIALPDTPEKEVVPEYYVLASTIFGVPVRVFRVNGTYGWSGRYSILGEVTVERVKGRKDDGTVVYMEGTHKKYLYVGEFQIAIWNALNEKGMTLLASVAKDGSTLYNTLVYSLRLHDPILWVRNDDPVLLIAERARSALRNTVMLFTVRDNTLVRYALSSLMNGYGIATAFIRDAVGGHKAGSIVRDRGDVPILIRYSLDSEDATYPDKDTVCQELEAKIKANASEAMLKQVTDNEKVDVECHSIEDNIGGALKATGAVLESATIGQIMFSETVGKSADKAASEEWQLEAQVMSAQAAAKYAETLRDAQPEKPTKLDELQVVLGAAQDNPDAVRVTWVGGQYDAVGSSIVAAAQNLQPKGDT